MHLPSHRYLPSHRPPGLVPTPALGAQRGVGMRSLALNRLWGSEADAGDTLSLSSDARVANLEAQLTEERRKLSQKDEEILQMQKLMAKLESVIEQQAKVSEKEQTRLSSLETVLYQKQEAEESEKVKKLVLALSEVKRQKEAAEKLATDEGNRAERLAKEVDDLQRQLAGVQPRSGTSLDNSQVEELQRLREDYAQEQQKREDAEVREKMHRAKLEQVENQLAEARASKADSELQLQVAEKEQRVQELLQKLSDPSTGEDVVIGELQERLNSEEKRRRETESLVADRDGQLRHLRERLSNEEEERVRREQKVLQYEGDLRDSKLEKSEVMTRLSAKESQIVELQRQLAEELTQRQAAQKQLVEKERLLKDAWSREEPIDRLSAQQAIQEQVIEKEREVCSLQQQLADELSKRQAVQYQIIEKDRVICELQTQNRGSRKLSGLMKHPATSASCRRHLDKSATLTYT
ncbi:Reticulocyte-binding protein 2-like a [Durusdinium trenchii]|uniref:Reticulocyte-binding protein 2-like a n=1 Tax=Durusdinium trenchii TaxID=1381693 RepID=A0ABP0QME7_9DINO